MRQAGVVEVEWRSRHTLPALVPLFSIIIPSPPFNRAIWPEQVERQIEQMVRFIKQEAEEKANEIKVSAEEVRRSRRHAAPVALAALRCCCRCMLCATAKPLLLLPLRSRRQSALYPVAAAASNGLAALYTHCPAIPLPPPPHHNITTGVQPREAAAAGAGEGQDTQGVRAARGAGRGQEEDVSAR